MLLDIEMPKLNGIETFERMKEFAGDIPVIFLTGRGDRESVRNVMALKPEGYLLKTMPDEEIKKCIDGFFAKKETE